jgi:amino acid transporter
LSKVVGLLSGAFCYAELGTIVKESGADYSYIHAGYGSFFAYIFSWVNNILVKPASLATITLTCAQYTMVLLFDDGCGDAPDYIKKLLAVFIMRLSSKYFCCMETVYNYYSTIGRWLLHPVI